MILQDLILEDETVHEDAYVSPEARSATLDLVKRLRDKYTHKAGFIFVLGYREAQNPKSPDRKYITPLRTDYIAEMDRHVNVRDPSAFTTIEYILDQYDKSDPRAHLNDDGAYILDFDGWFLHSAEKLRPDPADVADEVELKKGMEPRYDMPLSQRCGFAKDVGTKHTAGWATSHRMPHAWIYVVSEETGDIRVFHDGKIVQSPYEQEIYGFSVAGHTMK